MELFKATLKKDFSFGLESRALTKYADHGIQFIAETCLREITQLLSTQRSLGVEALILIRFNLFQLEKHVLRLFIEDSLTLERSLLEGIATMKNTLYEQILTVLNNDIDLALTAFLGANFRKKNPHKRSPDTFVKLVQPLVVP
jgi:hypothetical protein